MTVFACGLFGQANVPHWQSCCCPIYVEIKFLYTVLGSQGCVPKRKSFEVTSGGIGVHWIGRLNVEPEFLSSERQACKSIQQILLCPAISALHQQTLHYTVKTLGR